MEKTTNQPIIKIAIVGAESTGKSTLTKQLAQHYNSVYVPEFARSYFNLNDINNYTINDINQITQKQIELENELMSKANRFLFCDTAMITLKLWALNEFNTESDIISHAFSNRTYDLFLICNNDVPWEDDGQRKHKHLREHLFKWNKHELIKHNLNYKIVKCIGSERLDNAVNIINEKF